MALLNDLGIKVLGAHIWHHDQRFDNDDERLDVLKFNVEHFGNFKLGVCNKQSYEVVSALNKLKPDIFISRHMATVWSAKLGIPSFLSVIEPSEMLYDGLIRYGELIWSTLKNPAFIKIYPGTASFLIQDGGLSRIHSLF
jgi:nitrogenase molybdenum-iron protein alpha chain